MAYYLTAFSDFLPTLAGLGLRRSHVLDSEKAEIILLIRLVIIIILAKHQSEINLEIRSNIY